MATNSLLLDPQLHSFARAYMWQLLRQGKFAEPATEPLHVLAQELAQAIAAVPGDRDHKGRLLGTIAQYLSGGDLSAPPPAEVQALLRPLLSPEGAPDPAAPAPAPEGPAAPDAAAPAPADGEPSPSPAAEPAAAEPAASAAAAPAGSESAAAAGAVDPQAVAEPVATADSPAAAEPAVAQAAGPPDAAEGPATGAGAAPVSEDAAADFAAQNPPPAYHPSPTAEPAAEAEGAAAARELPPAGPAQAEGAPGVSTEVKPSGGRRSRRN